MNYKKNKLTTMVYISAKKKLKTGTNTGVGNISLLTPVLVLVLDGILLATPVPELDGGVPPFPIV